MPLTAPDEAHATGRCPLDRHRQTPSSTHSSRTVAPHLAAVARRLAEDDPRATGNSADAVGALAAFTTIAIVSLGAGLRKAGGRETTATTVTTIATATTATNGHATRATTVIPVTLVICATVTGRGQSRTAALSHATPSPASPSHAIQSLVNHPLVSHLPVNRLPATRPNPRHHHHPSPLLLLHLARSLHGLRPSWTAKHPRARRQPQPLPRREQTKNQLPRPARKLRHPLRPRRHRQQSQRSHHLQAPQLEASRLVHVYSNHYRPSPSAHRACSG